MNYYNDNYWDKRYEWRREEWHREDNEYLDRRCDEECRNRHAGRSMEQDRDLVMSRYPVSAELLAITYDFDFPVGRSGFLNEDPCRSEAECAKNLEVESLMFCEAGSSAP